MNYPENFTRGDIDDVTFRKAYDMAFAKKSPIGIRQLMAHSGVPEERSEEYIEQIIGAAKQARKRINRPHIIIGWLGIILGVVGTILLFQSGWIFTLTIILVFAGIYWITSHSD